MDHLRAALAYANRGFPVFPLAPRSKLPLIPADKGGHGLRDATTDVDQIRGWWTARPDANIGLRTGLVFDVIDLDNEAAIDALEAARDGRERICGPVVATAKGFHYLVRPTGLGNRAGVSPVSISGAGMPTLWLRLHCIHRAFATAGSSMIASALRRPGSSS